MTLCVAATFVNLEDEHVEAIARAHSQTLESIDLSECSRISWKSVATLLRECRQLHSLDVCYCTRLASEEPRELATLTLQAAALQLRHLNLSSDCLNRPNLETASTYEYFEGFTALQDLRICGSALTDERVEHVPPL